VPASPTLAERAAAIELLVLDVDGVLTDGRIIYSEHGDELKQFHVRDGSAIRLWQEAGWRVALLTGRSSNVVSRRAQELGIRMVHQGCADKFAAYRTVLAECGVSADKVCAVGDDVPDLPLLRNCGLAIAVADACSEAIAAAHYVTRAPGGRGAVRETVELILRSQAKWQMLVERYRSCAL
jgi:3-deoxy-D-manno-octulosonate 8-phosphate phosphatase (KDO 8-P phosphatase)